MIPTDSPMLQNQVYQMSTRLYSFILLNCKHPTRNAQWRVEQIMWMKKQANLTTQREHYEKD